MSGKHIFVLGGLGSGKSTLMSVLHSGGQDINAQEFKASNSNAGFTQDFQTSYSREFGVQLTDSPGLGDPNIPVAQWLNIYNSTFQKSTKDFDMCLVVIERTERIGTQAIQLITILDTVLRHIKPDNIGIIMNKCMAESDEIEDIMEFYNELKTQAGAKNLPELTNRNMCMINRSPLIKKRLQGNELMEAQLKLHNVIKEPIMNFVNARLAQCKSKIQSKHTEFQEVQDKITDPETLKAMEEDKKRYEDNIEKMKAQQAAAEEKHAKEMATMKDQMEKDKKENAAKLNAMAEKSKKELNDMQCKCDQYNKEIEKKMAQDKATHAAEMKKLENASQAARDAAEKRFKEAQAEAKKVQDQMNKKMEELKQQPQQNTNPFAQILGGVANFITGGGLVGAGIKALKK